MSSARVADFAAFIFGNIILKIRSLNWESTVVRMCFGGVGVELCAVELVVHCQPSSFLYW